MTKRILATAFLGLISSVAVAAPSQDVTAMLASQGLILTMLAVFVFGVGVGFTPCVYPMIPITLSIIGARSAGQKPITGFLRSLVFVLGIAIIYSILGLVAARMDKAFGFLFQNRWFVGVIALFFIAMGLSMLGMFTLQMPASFSAKLQGGANRGGFIGAFLLGLVTGVVASPCGSPVLVSILLLAAQGGQAAIGVSLLFMYALGIGLLFLVLGTFPSFLKAMPKSGVWMEDIKKLMGAVLIAVGVYYLRPPVVPAAIFWPLVVVLTLGAAVTVAIAAGHRRDSRNLFFAWRAVGIALAVAAIYFAVEKAPSAIAGTPKAKASDNWLTNEPAALKQAADGKLPMIVDFGAEWCAACKELEHKTFSDLKVKEAMSGFVKVRIDCTEETEENVALQKKYGSVSLPTVAFIDSTGKHLKELNLYEFEKPAEFIERLKKVSQ